MSASIVSAAAAGLVSEKDFLQAVRDLATLLGWSVFHTHDSRRSPAGFPDLVMVRGGRLVAAELKRAGKHPTPAQAAWLGALGAVPGVEACLWRPGDWEAVMACLR